MKGFILEGTLDDPKIVTFSNPSPSISEIESQDFRQSKNKTFEIQKEIIINIIIQRLIILIIMISILSYLIKRSKKMRLKRGDGMKK